MNTFEKCQKIRRIIMTYSAEVMAYKTLSDEFCANQIRNIPDSLSQMKGGKDLFDIQPSDLTEPQMIDLGFGRWSEESTMRLIPLWLLPFLTDVIETECIDGEKKTMNKSQIDNYHRCGCLAFGVTPKVLS